MPLTLTGKLDSREWTTGENASVEMVCILKGIAKGARSIRLRCGYAGQPQ